MPPSRHLADNKSKAALINRPGRRALLIQMGLSLLAACAAGVLLFLFWHHHLLPDAPPADYWGGAVLPGGLALFAALAIPAAAWAPTLVLGLLVRFGPQDPGHASQKILTGALAKDAATYLFLPVAILVPVLWQEISNGFLALGLCFLGLVTAKTLILLWVLWRGFLKPADENSLTDNKAPLSSIFLVALVIFGLSGLWAQQASPPSPQEISYLLAAQAWTHQVEDAHVSPKAPATTSWGHWKDLPPPDPRPYLKSPFTMLIAPAMALGGLFGVHFLFALLTALLAVLLVRWLKGAGLSVGYAAAAVGIVLASAPVMALTRQIGPELFAMVLLAEGLCLLRVLPTHPWRSGLGLAGAALLLSLLQADFWPLAAGLLVWGIYTSLRQPGPADNARPAWWLCLGLTAALALVLILAAWINIGTDLPASLRAAASQAGAQKVWGLPAGPFGLGLFIIAPVYVLALAGLPSALRLYPKYALMAFIPLVFFAVWLWMGGHFARVALTGGLTAGLVPVGALFLAPCLSALNRPWLRVLAGLPVVFSLGWSWIMTLMPVLGVSRKLGGNPLVKAVENSLKIDLHRFLPMGPGPTTAVFAWTTVLALLTMGLALYCWPKARQKEGPDLKPWTKEEVMALALAGGLIIGGFLALGMALTP